MEFSKRLKELRVERNLTQQQIAEKLGMGYQNYQKWERGRRTPNKKNLELLAQILGVTVSYLIEDEIFEKQSSFYSDYEKLNDEQKNLVHLFVKDILDNG